MISTAKEPSNFSITITLHNTLNKDNKVLIISRSSVRFLMQLHNAMLFKTVCSYETHHNKIPFYYSTGFIEVFNIHKICMCMYCIHIINELMSMLYCIQGQPEDLIRSDFSKHLQQPSQPLNAVPPQLILAPAAALHRSAYWHNSDSDKNVKEYYRWKYT